MPPCSRRSPYAAERLLLAADWREAADEVLERMGVPRGRRASFVIENRTDATGRLLGTMRHAWCAPGVGPRWGPSLEGASWDDGLARWAAVLARGEPVVSRIADLPEAERPGFMTHGVVSIAEHPIFVGDRVVGHDRVRRLRARATVGVPSSMLCARRPR